MPVTLRTSPSGGAQVTILDTGTENLLIPETAWGVLCRRAEQTRHGDGTAQEELSITRAWGISRGPAEDGIASEAPVTTCNRMGPPILLERADPLWDPYVTQR